MKSDRDLSACIRIDEARISRRISIPHRIYFELDRNRLEEIEAVIKQQGNLRLSAQQLVSLRYYSLINSPLGNSDRFSLIFTSNYSLNQNKVSTTVIRSTIELTGKISQEIQQEFWSNPSLASRVLRVHYWSISEILKQLPMKNQPSFFLTACLWCSIAIAILALGYLLPFQFAIKLALAILIIFCCQLWGSNLIQRYFKPWLLHQLLTGFFATTSDRRKWGFMFLTLLS